MLGNSKNSHENCNNISGIFKYKVVDSDEELIKLLESGWALEKELPHGRYLIKKRFSVMIYIEREVICFPDKI
jgi:hypothetical protein